VPPLRPPLLVLAIVLASLWGTGGTPRPSASLGSLAPAPSFDAIERFLDGTALLPSRTTERTASHRQLSVLPTRAGRDVMAERSARVAARLVPSPATHAAHLVLLTHQRNDIDA
jgi:hypothetical protein